MKSEAQVNLTIYACVSNFPDITILAPLVANIRRCIIRFKLLFPCRCYYDKEASLFNWGNQHKRTSGDTVSGSHCNLLDLQLIVQANKVYSFMILSNCCGTTSVLLSRRQPDWRSKGSDFWRSKESDLWRSKESYF